MTTTKSDSNNKSLDTADVVSKIILSTSFVLSKDDDEMLENLIRFIFLFVSLMEETILEKTVFI